MSWIPLASTIAVGIAVGREASLWLSLFSTPLREAIYARWNAKSERLNTLGGARNDS